MTLISFCAVHDHGECACWQVYCQSGIERVSQCKGAFAGLSADDGSEAEAADQKGYMTAFS